MIDFLQTKAFPVPLNWCINLATCGKSSFHSGDIPNGGPCLASLVTSAWNIPTSGRETIPDGGWKRWCSKNAITTYFFHRTTMHETLTLRRKEKGTRNGSFSISFSQFWENVVVSGKTKRKNRFPPALLVCYTSNRVQDIYSQFLRMCTAYMFATSRWLWWVSGGSKKRAFARIFFFSCFIFLLPDRYL